MRCSKIVTLTCVPSCECRVVFVGSMRHAQSLPRVTRRCHALRLPIVDIVGSLRVILGCFLTCVGRLGGKVGTLLHRCFIVVDIVVASLVGCMVGCCDQDRHSWSIVKVSVDQGTRLGLGSSLSPSLFRTHHHSYIVAAEGAAR